MLGTIIFKVVSPEKIPVLQMKGLTIPLNFGDQLE